MHSQCSVLECVIAEYAGFGWGKRDTPIVFETADDEYRLRYSYDVCSDTYVMVRFDWSRTLPSDVFIELPWKLYIYKTVTPEGA